jgi:excisionase family DNA binding protein
MNPRPTKVVNPMQDSDLRLPDASSVPVERIPPLLTQLAAFQVQLAARLTVAPAAPAPAAGESPLLEASQMAERLGVHESKVRTMGRAGKIPIRHIGRYVRFCPAEVEAALQAVDKN